MHNLHPGANLHPYANLLQLARVQSLKAPFTWPKIHPGCKFAPGQIAHMNEAKVAYLMIFDDNSKISFYEDLTKIMLWVLIRIASPRRF